MEAHSRLFDLHGDFLPGKGTRLFDLIIRNSTVVTAAGLFDGKAVVNVCYLVRHAAIRLAVMGLESRPAGDDELERMKWLVAEGMREGAVGFSTGLTYTPS